MIDMAREAGMTGLEAGGLFDNFLVFEALVRADEREACAKVCETHGVHPALNVYAGGLDWYKHGKDCAAAIRNRGNT
jgi:hypothetical protein